MIVPHEPSSQCTGQSVKLVLQTLEASALGLLSRSCQEGAPDIGMAEHTRRLAVRECSQVILILVEDLSAEGDGPSPPRLVRQPFGQVEQAHVNGVWVDLNRDAVFASTGIRVPPGRV